MVTFQGQTFFDRLRAPRSLIVHTKLGENMLGSLVAVICQKRYELETSPKVAQFKVNQIQKINIWFYSCGLFLSYWISDFQGITLPAAYRRLYFQYPFLFLWIKTLSWKWTHVGSCDTKTMGCAIISACALIRTNTSQIKNAHKLVSRGGIYSLFLMILYNSITVLSTWNVW